MPDTIARLTKDSPDWGENGRIAAPVLPARVPPSRCEDVPSATSTYHAASYGMNSMDDNYTGLMRPLELDVASALVNFKHVASTRTPDSTTHGGHVFSKRGVLRTTDTPEMKPYRPLSRTLESRSPLSDVVSDVEAMELHHAREIVEEQLRTARALHQKMSSSSYFLKRSSADMMESSVMAVVMSSAWQTDSKRPKYFIPP